MSHQPFENWIFEPEELSQEERQQLYTHLESCPECRQMQAAWRKADALLQAKPMVHPAAGFAMRWEEGLERRKADLQSSQHSQVRRFFVYIGLVNAMAIIAFLALSVIKGAFVDWVFDAFQGLLAIPNILTGLVTTITSLFEAMPAYLSLIIWVAVTGSLTILTLIWIFSLWRTTFRGVSIR